MQGVTYISQLPDLKELQTPPPPQFPTNDYPGHDPRAGNVGKFIRGSHNRPSLMEQPYDGNGGLNGSGADLVGPGGYLTPPPPPPPPPREDEWLEDADFEFDEKPSTSGEVHVKRECSCREVYDHIQSCNICKSFYMEGRSHGVFYAIIIAQLILIAVLATKVYEIRVKRS
jgi:hypothetical protein